MHSTAVIIQVRSKDEENKSNFQYKEEKHDKMKKE